MNNNYHSLNEEGKRVATLIVNTALKIHKALGRGLLERIYEVCTEYELKQTGLQVDIPIVYEHFVFDEDLRLDLLVNDKVIVELKAADAINPV